MKIKLFFLTLCFFCVVVENSVLAVFQGTQVTSENNVGWCQVCIDRDMQIRQWIASQVVYNRIRVLEEQLSYGDGFKNKKEMVDK